MCFYTRVSNYVQLNSSEYMKACVIGYKLVLYISYLQTIYNIYFTPNHITAFVQRDYTIESTIVRTKVWLSTWSTKKSISNLYLTLTSRQSHLFSFLTTKKSHQITKLPITKICGLQDRQSNCLTFKFWLPHTYKNKRSLRHWLAFRLCRGKTSTR